MRERFRSLRSMLHALLAADPKGRRPWSPGSTRVGLFQPGSGCFLRYGAAELDEALREATARGAFAAHSVAHVLDQRRRTRGQPIPIDVILPDDSRVRDLVLTPHALESYDRLARAGQTQPNDDSEPDRD